MIQQKTIALIIPARNEADSITRVLQRVPRQVDRIIVVDNGSEDGTGEIARAGGAQVVREKRPGYGQACLAGIDVLAQNPPDIVAFADGDGSDNHGVLCDLLIPLIKEGRDMVLARRIPQTPRALSFQQKMGNGLAARLMRFFWGGDFTDLGPMRALTWKALQKLNMQDINFGWTIEMQIKALQQDYRIREIPVLYLPRFAGKSKISRTFSGVISAGTKILWIVFREAWKDRRRLINRLEQNKVMK
ncbi:MAG: glycosyltransferase family 2 protein [Pseudomonadota bacterium]